MADNYLEKRYEQYQARKSAWEKAGKQGKKKPSVTQPLFHRFTVSIADIPLPEKFTYPFCYTPHPLCIQAAQEVQAYLTQQEEWKEELAQGKMFGVLVVQTGQGEVGYLAAFSGILAGKNIHPFFVPPVFDLLRPQGFFKVEENRISQISHQIQELEASEEYREMKARLTAMCQSVQATLTEAGQQLKAAKQQRDQRRKETPLSADEENELIRESQYQKAEYKRLVHRLKEEISPLETRFAEYEAHIQELKQERKTRSAALQQQLFERFRMMNRRGETRTLNEIFAQTVHKTPPAGAGECAAPKLLQYAYLHGWKPIAMAEFWWGASPKTEIRHHGEYYPACKGKCEPILNHMLQGLEVEANPIAETLQHNPVPEIEIVYEDKWLAVVNKPEGLLSVPGKEEAVSVYSLMRERYPDTDSPLMVHRLDMATSGLMVIAKSKEAHRHLQEQFEKRLIRKRYIALLEGNVVQDKGIIDLPICPDPLDRPRQVVDRMHGKPAITEYEVLERTDNRTRVAFYPHTGRTHQLRVHAAHPLGLHCPIVGDELYGHKADRLYLHAEALEFRHPETGEEMRFMIPSF